MRKNKLQIFLAVLTIIFLFGTAAICSQCSQNGEPPDTEPVETPPDGEPAEEEPPSAPTIKLSILEGYPKYLEESDICYYRIEAEVTDSPTPDVVFSQDDSEGSWGDYIAQVNIDSVDEVIVLTATATNSEGSDDASIELGWGCNGEENRDPEITEIIIPGGKLYVDSQYDISVEATDPDEDDLNYQWSISADGGDFEDENSNPTKWNTSDAADTYTLEVIVTDEKGGEDSKSKSVDINPTENIDLPKIVDEGGWLEESGLINPGELACIGDIPGGDSCRGFVSFDITGISEVIVKSATLTLSPRMEFGDISFFDLIRIDSLEWGENEIDFSLFDIAGEFIQGFGSPDITCSIEELKTELQGAVNDGRTRFQIRIYCTPRSNGDGIPDGWDYNQSDINLNIDYVPLG